MRPDGRAGDRLPLVIVGAGRVGSSLAIDLARAARATGSTAADVAAGAQTGPGSGPEPARPARFAPITVVCRSDPEPMRSSRLTALDIALVRAEPRTGLPDAVFASAESKDPVYLFCVPDDRLVETAAAWGDACADGRLPRPAIALHTSGLHDASVLAPLRRCGAAVAGCHPLVAIATPGNGHFHGITFGIDGDPKAVALATELAGLLGGRPRRIRPEARPIYHLAAVFGSNFLVACLFVAAELLAESGEDLSPGDALAELLPLARSALDTLEGEGLPDGVTGPIVRGDVGTVERHLLALDPARRDLYRALGTELLAAREDRLEAEVVARLRASLGPGGGDDEQSEGGASDGG